MPYTIGVQLKLHLHVFSLTNISFAFMPFNHYCMSSFANLLVSLILTWFYLFLSIAPFSSRVQWSQFKNYFLFKLEKVMDDFRASAPEQRGPANPNVESIPFEDMKERILKIVKGYNG